MEAANFTRILFDMVGGGDAPRRIFSNLSLQRMLGAF
jgi:hypothetical protein